MFHVKHRKVVIMRYYKYQNKLNPIKFIEVKRYDCGHYVWKQFLLTRNGTACRNYNGCILRRSHVGTWRRG